MVNNYMYRANDTDSMKKGCSYGVKLNSEDIINKYKYN